MQRQLMSELIAWKSRANRKPLLLKGARQTGKTWLLNEFASQQYRNVIRFDFMLLDAGGTRTREGASTRRTRSVRSEPTRAAEADAYLRSKYADVPPPLPFGFSCPLPPEMRARFFWAPVGLYVAVG